MKLGRAGYKFTVTPQSPDLWAVEITEGKYEGLQYKYSWWEIQTHKDPETMEDKKRLNFKFDCMFKPQGIDAGKTNLELMSLMGNVLLQILMETARIPNVEEPKV